MLLYSQWANGVAHHQASPTSIEVPAEITVIHRPLSLFSSLSELLHLSSLQQSTQPEELKMASIQVLLQERTEVEPRAISSFNKKQRGSSGCWVASLAWRGFHFGLDEFLIQFYTCNCIILPVPRFFPFQRVQMLLKGLHKTAGSLESECKKRCTFFSLNTLNDGNLKVIKAI